MDTRPEPDLDADERTTLVQFLDYFRATLEWKASGLTDEQSRLASVEPSELTVLGLVRHLAYVERWWFREAFAGEELEPLFDFSTDRDAELHPGPEVTLAESLEQWREQVAGSRTVLERCGSLDTPAVHIRDGRHMTMRWILVHMIEEYARHCGHLDLLRERIDGQTGD
jgi:hypothetical protein